MNGSEGTTKVKTYVAVVDQKTLPLQGESAIDALKRAGLVPKTQTTSISKYVGVLTNGRRYSINIQPRRDSIRVGKKDV